MNTFHVCCGCRLSRRQVSAAPDVWVGSICFAGLKEGQWADSGCFRLASDPMGGRLLVCCAVHRNKILCCSNQAKRLKEKEAIEAASFYASHRVLRRINMQMKWWKRGSDSFFTFAARRSFLLKLRMSASAFERVTSWLRCSSGRQRKVPICGPSWQNCLTSIEIG